MLAAGRGRYSVARYAAHADPVKRTSGYSLVDAAGLVDLVSKSDGADAAERVQEQRALFCGDVDAALSKVLLDHFGERALIAPAAMNARRAGFLAELAWARLQRGESDDVASLAPMYLPHESVEGSKPER